MSARKQELETAIRQEILLRSVRGDQILCKTQATLVPILKCLYDFTIRSVNSPILEEMVSLTFTLQRGTTSFGQNIAVVGSFQNWQANPVQAIQLSSNEHTYPEWRSVVPLTLALDDQKINIEYKFVRMRQTGNQVQEIIWENGQNRKFTMPIAKLEPGDEIQIIDEEFNKTKAQCKYNLIKKIHSTDEDVKSFKIIDQVSNWANEDEQEEEEADKSQNSQSYEIQNNLINDENCYTEPPEQQVISETNSHSSKNSANEAEYCDPDQEKENDQVILEETQSCKEPKDQNQATIYKEQSVSQKSEDESPKTQSDDDSSQDFNEQQDFLITATPELNQVDESADKSFVTTKVEYKFDLGDIIVDQVESYLESTEEKQILCVKEQNDFQLKIEESFKTQAKKHSSQVFNEKQNAPNPAPSESTRVTGSAYQSSGPSGALIQIELDDVNGEKPLSCQESAEAKRICLEEEAAAAAEAERVRQEEEAAAAAEAERLRHKEEAAAAAEAEKVRQEQEAAEAAEVERLRLEKEEADRIEAERIEAERIEADRVEAVRLAAEEAEAERLRQEEIRLALEKEEAERKEAERIRLEQEEAERLEAERLQHEKEEAERIEAERIRIEAEEAAKAEEERIRLEKEEAESTGEKEISSLKDQSDCLQNGDQSPKTQNGNESSQVFDDKQNVPNSANYESIQVNGSDDQSSSPQEALNQIELDDVTGEKPLSCQESSEGKEISSLKDQSDSQQNQAQSLKIKEELDSSKVVTEKQDDPVCMNSEGILGTESVQQDPATFEAEIYPEPRTFQSGNDKEISEILYDNESELPSKLFDVPFPQIDQSVPQVDLSASFIMKSFLSKRPLKREIFVEPCITVAEGDQDDVSSMSSGYQTFQQEIGIGQAEIDPQIL